MLDLVSMISYLDVNNLDAKLFLYVLFGVVVLSADWLNKYYCFNASSKIIYLVPLNFIILGQMYWLEKFKFVMCPKRLSYCNFY